VAIVLSWIFVRTNSTYLAFCTLYGAYGIALEFPRSRIWRRDSNSDMPAGFFSGRSNSSNCLPWKRSHRNLAWHTTVSIELDKPVRASHCRFFASAQHQERPQLSRCTTGAARCCYLAAANCWSGRQLPR